MGIVIGAASFFPNLAFAEKNRSAGQLELQNLAVHTRASEKIENTVASKKAAPENINESQGGVIQEPVPDPGNGQTEPIEPVPKPPDLTNRSIGKPAPSLEKKVKAGKPAEPAVKVKVTGQTRQVEPKPVTKTPPKITKSVPSNEIHSQEDSNRQFQGLNGKPKTFTDEKESSASKKASSSLKLALKPFIDENNKTPTNKRKNPGEIEIMNNPPQRTPSSGGQTNEHLSPGAGTLSFIANGIDWDEYFGLNFRQIFTSRQAKYCHQWINAPPSPPPKAAPFFLTFTA